MDWAGKAVERGNPPPLEIDEGFWVLHRFDQIAQEGLDCEVGHRHLPEVGVGDPQRKSACGRQSFIL